MKYQTSEDEGYLVMTNYLHIPKNYTTLNVPDILGRLLKEPFKAQLYKNEENKNMLIISNLKNDMFVQYSPYDVEFELSDEEFKNRILNHLLKVLL